MNIINIKLSDLKPYERNPQNNKEAVDYVANSIREFGFKNPIIVDKNNVIVAGHTRYLACKKLGIKEVPCVIADDLTDEQIKAFRLADNKVAEIATWDLDLLDEELNDLFNFDMSDFGFDVGLEELEEAQEDEFDIDELPEEPKAKLGDIYQLGNHRLMCGDSTVEKDVNKLVGEATIDLLITDPPYNVAIKNSRGMTIENDNMENDAFHEFLVNAFTNAYNVIKGGGCFYCWYASKEVVNFHTSLEESGFTVKQELIWNKNSMVMGRQDYQWKHEPCLYGWKETDPHVWYGDRKQTTVIDWNRPTKSDLHPTMKPIGLFDYQIRNSTKQGENVLDLFGGSGTTIMACEQNDRHAYVMEYDPKYVDVIISRWEQYTGKKARKVKG